MRKSSSKSFNNGIIENRVGLKCICETVSRQHTQLFYKLFTIATESGRSTRVCNVRKILPIIVPKCQGGKKYVFDKNISKSSEFYYLEPSLYPSVTDIGEPISNLIQERHNHSEN